MYNICIIYAYIYMYSYGYLYGCLLIPTVSLIIDTSFHKNKRYNNKGYYYYTTVQNTYSTILYFCPASKGLFILLVIVSRIGYKVLATNSKQEPLNYISQISYRLLLSVERYSYNRRVLILPPYHPHLSKTSLLSHFFVFSSQKQQLYCHLSRLTHSFPLCCRIASHSIA